MAIHCRENNLRHEKHRAPCFDDGKLTCFLLSNLGIFAQGQYSLNPLCIAPILVIAPKDICMHHETHGCSLQDCHDRLMATPSVLESLFHGAHGQWTKRKNS